MNTNPELVPLPADGTWVRFYYPDTEETVENLFYYNAATGRKLKTVVDNSKSWLTAESYAHYFEVFKGYIDAKPAGWTFVPHKKKDKEWLKYAAPDDTVWTVWAPHRFSDIPTLPLNLELVQAVNDYDAALKEYADRLEREKNEEESVETLIAHVALEEAASKHQPPEGTTHALELLEPAAEPSEEQMNEWQLSLIHI